MRRLIPNVRRRSQKLFTRAGSGRRTDLLASAAVSCFYLRAAKSILPAFLPPPPLLENKVAFSFNPFPEVHEKPFTSAPIAGAFRQKIKEEF